MDGGDPPVSAVQKRRQGIYDKGPIGTTGDKDIRATSLVGTESPDVIAVERPIVELTVHLELFAVVTLLAVEPVASLENWKIFLSTPAENSREFVASVARHGHLPRVV